MSSTVKVAQKPRWLVFNKVDLMPEEEADEKILKKSSMLLGWEDEYFKISAGTRGGTKDLCFKLGEVHGEPTT
ncbi:hypothetical protein OH492_22665 [Vibrio chagasii]|nr:hypothetical protein [Vibrio chagasii]